MGSQFATSDELALSGRRSVHVSLPWASIVEPPDHEVGLTWARRSVDWGLSSLRRRAQHIVAGLKVMWEGRQAEAIIVCHSGMDVIVAGLAHRLLLRKRRLTAVDFLLPPKTPRRLVRIALGGVNEFITIRTGDIRVLVGLGVPEGHCRFVPYAAPPLEPQNQVTAGDYVYSGGSSQRDWVTLADALARCDIPSVISCPVPEQEFPKSARSLGLVKPEIGREYLEKSRFLVQSIIDNDQPSGPLLILDAFSLGKPVVASNVSGTRDYVEHDVNGVLVPPGDADALAVAISSLYEDHQRIDRLSIGARETASSLTSRRFWNGVLGTHLRGQGESVGT